MDKLVEYMRLYERFGGLRVASCCIMSNQSASGASPLRSSSTSLRKPPHRPDAAEPPDDAGLVAKFRRRLGDKLVNELEWRFELHRTQENSSSAEELRGKWYGARPLRGLAGESKDDRPLNFRQLRTGDFG